MRLFIILILTIFSFLEHNSEDLPKGNITYCAWKTSILESVKHLNSSEFILTNFQAAIGRVDSDEFNLLKNDSNYSKKGYRSDSTETYILFCVREGEVATQELKILTIGASECHEATCTARYTEKYYKTVRIFELS